MPPGSSERLPRRVFLASLTLVVLGGAFALGAFAQGRDLPPIPQARAAYQSLTAFGDNDLTHDPRAHHLQPTRDQGAGVTVDEVSDDALVLMAGFFDDENQVRLVRRDGSVVRSWSMDLFEQVPDPDDRACAPTSPLRVDTHGLHLTAEGDVLVNYEYCGTVRVDACGEVRWSLQEQTHHAIVPAEDGGFWALGRDRWSSTEEPDRFPPFSDAPDRILLEDTLLRIGEDGEVVDKVSIPALMREGGLEAPLTASPARPFALTPTLDGWEIVHANKVTELSSEVADAFPGFEAGDLAISLRARNLVMVVDPDTWEVRWHQTGPWLRQHDPEFRPDGRISIFDNHVYGTAYVDEQVDLETPRSSRVVAVDPATGETEVVFGGTPAQEMLTVMRGDHQLLEDGGMLVTEFDGGRVLQVDADGRVVWEYVNAHDDQHVGEVTNAVLVPADVAADWSPCD